MRRGVMISRAEIKKNAKKSILNNYGSAVAASIAAAAAMMVPYIILKGLSMVIDSDWLLPLAVIPCILLLPLYVGTAGIFLKMYRREDEIGVKQILEIGFKADYRRNLAGILLRTFKLFLWSLMGLVSLYFGLVLILMSSFQGSPLERDYSGFNGITYVVFSGAVIISIAAFIPYIMKIMSYSMTPYILAEDRDISPSKALKLSESMTKGHRFEIFVVYLSFIGWIILAAISSILCILTGPYISESFWMTLVAIILDIFSALWIVPYMSATFAGIYGELKAE